jgi:hypothetical protein
VSDLDDYLIRRTEQAVLGALLTGADPAQAGALRPLSFADPVHQAIYAAFTRPGRNWAGRLRDQAARITSRRVKDAVGYIADLPALCPEAAHLAVYAGMLTQPRPGHPAAGAGQPGQPSGQEQRPASGPGQQLEGASQWLSATTAGQRGPRGTPNPRLPGKAWASESLDPATERLSRAIRTAAGVGHPRQGRRSRARQAGAAAADPAPPGGGSTPPSLGKEDLQDAVLADLMRHPADGQDIVQRLPLNVFTRGPRQDLYRLIAWPVAQGKPVDWLITAWQASKQDPSGHDALAAAGATAAESLAATAMRLGAIRPLRGTAEVIGRALLADYEVSVAFGPQWTRQRDLNWAAARMPVADGQQASPEPGITLGPVTPAQDPLSPQAAQQAPVPAGPPQPATRRQAAPPPPEYSHGSQLGSRARDGRAPVPQTMPPPPTRGNAGWQPRPVQRR